MADEHEKAGRATRKRRSTGARGSLKRFNAIDSVIVEEPFTLSLPKDAAALAENTDPRKTENGNVLKAGDACYISATVQNRRYYGVLVDQAALKAASLLYFRDEASSLDLNRRMQMLKKRQIETQADLDQSFSENGQVNYGKRQAPRSNEEIDVKRQKSMETPAASSHPVQKFRYVDRQPRGPSSAPGYRVLLATYADVIAASEDDTEKEQLIEKACQTGGDFVGGYYYQYEVLGSSLEFSKTEKRTDVGFHTSMGFESFLRTHNLPVWFPLSNLEGGQHKVLSMLNMKKNSKGGVEWDTGASPLNAASAASASIHGTGTALPMERRTRFRVGVLGAGLAGLATAAELFRQSEKDNIDLEVVLLEGRTRVGGRLLTDSETFKLSDGTPFPVDLGASWIHGIDHNPLATLAQEAGVDFVTASEEVKMFGANMEGVDSTVDENMGKLFDDLLDQAAEDCWNKEDYAPAMLRNQKAVRWYASGLGPKPNADESCSTAGVGHPHVSDAPPHRFSSDVSIDHAIGNAILKRKKRAMSILSPMENSLMLWNTKNIEYALGANISDLSMKYWDADDRHAFEGDHVLLKQGYSTVVNHMMTGLEKHGERFKCVLGFAVGKVEYARNSLSQPYPDKTRRSRKTIELTDKCRVTSQDGKQAHSFDFVVCAMPLGVLKESISDQSEDKKVVFQPPLPDSKVDAIKSTGFGLLNKIYLQFPVAFWRLASALDEDQILFGNVSGLNPHHYMFFDVGKSLHGGEDAPAVLMTLISGMEAFESETMPETELVEDVMRTLRHIFSNVDVPNPIAKRTTRWGSDKFSRGCYTFLPPGATDQDFQLLQTPINGNGDSLVLESNETMRLFWAGEHTTALHPSMAHGALLSGIRAAREIMASIRVDYAFEHGFDRLVPIQLFRSKNPQASLQCGMCNVVGSGAREGPLLAFQRGSRQVIVHNKCAENSPEVEVKDGKWKHVIKAINRGKQIKCSMCGKFGGTIGCTAENCFRSFHFTCCEDTGWRFHKDGKVFYCDLHRTNRSLRTSLRCDVDPARGSECNRVSMSFYRSKFPYAILECSLCGSTAENDKRGKLFAFQRNARQVLVHENCAKYTNITETTFEVDHEEWNGWKNIFDALVLSKECALCERRGATITCSERACDRHFHYLCADKGWGFKEQHHPYKCELHRVERDTDSSFEVESKLSLGDKAEPRNGGLFQHALFGSGMQLHNGCQNGIFSSQSARVSLPSNAGSDAPLAALQVNEGYSLASDKGESSDEESYGDIMTCSLESVEDLNEGTKESVRMHRSSLKEPWGLSFSIGTRESGSKSPLLVHAVSNEDNSHDLRVGDRVASVNGSEIGSPTLNCLRDVLSLMRHSLELVVEVKRTG